MSRYYRIDPDAPSAEDTARVLNQFGVTAEELRQLLAGSRADRQTARDVSLTEAIDAYHIYLRECERSPRTITEYLRVLGDFSGFLRQRGADVAHLPGIGYQDLRAYLLERSTRRRLKRGETVPGKTALRTRQGAYAALSAFFGWASIEYHIPKPTRTSLRPRGKPPALPVHLSARHVLALLALARQQRFGMRDYAMCLVFIATGARVSEVSRLTLDDLDLGAHPTVRVHGKGGSEHILPLLAIVADALRAWVEFGVHRPHPDLDGTAALFPSMRGAAWRPLSPKGIEELFAGLFRRLKASFPDDRQLQEQPLTVHKLRHTFAVLAVLNQLPQAALQQMLRHRSPETTLLYQALNLAELTRLLNAHNPLRQLDDGTQSP